MILFFISKKGEESYDGIFDSQATQLGRNHGQWQQYAGKPILLGSENIGIHPDSNHKSQGYANIGDDRVLNTLPEYDSQNGYSLFKKVWELTNISDWLS